MSDPVIFPAAAADVDAAAQVLTAAFRDEEVMGAIFPDARRHAGLQRFFEHMLVRGLRPENRVDLARGEGGQLLGVAFWEGPSASFPLIAILREMTPVIRHEGLHGLLRATRLGRTLARYRPTAPHWHLSHLGVTAEAQGRGVGGALLSSRLLQIDAQDHPAYLESSNERNRALYRRFDFRDMADIRGIDGASPAAMWRQPQSQRTASAHGARVG